ncbi:MAG TPA: hypothetical protein PKZ17_04835 [Thermodesulfovibrio thiophilus]|uniref:hypothetical protein n=1 Tax=Thermodesulfovibrio thiophilus TaxID=340095 RepID=UPI0018386D71|nr:hypothetical protein [Thermodesulfovibrio thiophilus]HHW21190.1 hypothetical protein [Thermodesulfovibrio thiophilus]HOA82435.1 hypothetical protein [Thermodesulfovibrio thiophilus]HQA04049.1 hypothetical protein [Thermodesulfovibrio thiophilus]HQD36207.1 hypothetical protein [Thermodesulfovibrio thiophilus]
MKLIGIITAVLVVLILPLTLHSLTLEQCNDQNIKGNFDLIIYANAFINDPETFIVLDKVDDKVIISPYAPEFKYRIFKNLNDKEALKIVNEILKNPSFVSTIKCSTIKDEENAFGYELKPVYFPWVFGILEPVETVYKKKDSIITIFTNLNPRVEKQLYGGGGSDHD